MAEEKQEDNFTPKPIPGPSGAQLAAAATPPPVSAPSPVAGSPAPVGEEKIVVKKSVLDKILADQELQAKRNKDLEETVSILLQTADKGRLAHVQAMKGTPIVHEYRLRTFKSKGKQAVIIKWKLKEDIMEKNGNGMWVESQIVTIWTEDGETYDMPLAQFERVPKIPVKEKSQEKVDILGDLKVFYNVETAEGKAYRVEAPFIN